MLPVALIGAVTPAALPLSDWEPVPAYRAYTEFCAFLGFAGFRVLEFCVGMIRFVAAIVDAVAEKLGTADIQVKVVGTLLLHLVPQNPSLRRSWGNSA